jgi:hypothetical protein
VRLNQKSTKDSNYCHAIFRIFHQIEILGKSSCESWCNQHSLSPYDSALSRKIAKVCNIYSSLMTLAASREALSEPGTSTFFSTRDDRGRTPAAKRSVPSGLGYRVPRNIARLEQRRKRYHWDITSRGIALIPWWIKITRRGQREVKWTFANDVTRVPLHMEYSRVSRR